MSQLQVYYDQIMGAVCSEDIFGPARGKSMEEKLAELERVFQKISESVNPDVHTENLEAIFLSSTEARASEGMNSQAGS
jgi:hypothetical protein